MSWLADTPTGRPGRPIPTVSTNRPHVVVGRHTRWSGGPTDHRVDLRLDVARTVVDIGVGEPEQGVAAEDHGVALDVVALPRSAIGVEAKPVQLDDHAMVLRDGIHLTR